MRVIFHRRVLAGQQTGVGHYASQLLRAMRDLPQDVEIDCFPSGWLWSACHAWETLRFFHDRLALRKRHLRWLGCLAPLKWLAGKAFTGLAHAGLAVLDWQVQKTFGSGRYDLYHEPNFIPLRTELPTVVTVHDLSVLLHPEWHPARRVQVYERRFDRGLRQCQHVIAGSETIRQQVIRVMNLPAERVTRVYYGVRPHLEPLPGDYTAQMLGGLGLRPGYLLSLGTIEPRKNILMLLRAYCALPQALRDRCPLLLVGAWGWKSEPVREFYHAEARHRGVKHLGYLPDHQLPALYNGARALVYPSFYEGFGLPCMEMMACGGAVLASTAGVFRETLKGQANLIPAEDEGAWRRALARVIEEDDWLASLRRGATHLARGYTWEKTAAETLAVYRRVCDGAARRRTQLAA